MRHLTSCGLVHGIVLLLAGCGDGTSFSVNHHSLKLADQGYVHRSSYFCDKLAPDQIQVSLTDYAPTCGGPTAATDGGVATGAHSKVDFTLGLSGNPNRSKAFEIKDVDCTNGPGAGGTASFTYYPADGAAAEVTKATSGSVLLSRDFDPATITPATGTFDLTFADGSHITGAYNALSCN